MTDLQSALLIATAATLAIAAVISYIVLRKAPRFGDWER